MTKTETKKSKKTSKVVDFLAALGHVIIEFTWINAIGTALADLLSS